MRDPRVASLVSPLISVGLVATCAAVDFEALCSATSPRDYEDVWRDRRLAYEYLSTQDEHWRRALDVQRRLARTSRHRAVGLPDLLVAAVAEAHRVTVLRYDHDFDVIAEETGLSAQSVLARGSVMAQPAAYPAPTTREVSP